jgi:hypothetical protein
MQFKFFYFLGLLLIFPSCKTTTTGNNSSSIDLKDGIWYFHAYYDSGKTAIPLKKNFKLEFSDKEVSTQWDANSCSGSYSFKNDKLKFLQNFACTQICCDSEEAIQLQTAIFAGELTVEKTADDMLKLQTSSKEIPTILLSKTAPASIKLEGTSWIIAQKVDFSTNKTIKPKGKYVLNFDKDIATIQLDVNSCVQEISYEGQTIKIKGNDPTAGYCTEACCDSDDAVQYSHILRDGMKFELKDKNLILTGKRAEYTLSPLQEAKFEAVDIEKLMGSTWVSLDMTELEANLAMNSATKYYIAFEKGRFSVKLPVNVCKASYEYEDHYLMLPETDMACTKKCCEDKMDLAYLAHFKGRMKAELKGDILQLSNKLVELRFKKE